MKILSEFISNLSLFLPKYAVTYEKVAASVLNMLRPAIAKFVYDLVIEVCPETNISISDIESRVDATFKLNDGQQLREYPTQSRVQDRRRPNRTHSSTTSNDEPYDFQKYGLSEV